MVESNEDIIRNYFINGDTNALVEAINSKIHKLITSNNGNRDKDFFFFRISQSYAWHIKIRFSQVIEDEGIKLYLCCPIEIVNPLRGKSPFI